LSAPQQNGLYEIRLSSANAQLSQQSLDLSQQSLNLSQQSLKTPSNSKSVEEFVLWHRRLAHLNPKALSLLIDKRWQLRHNLICEIVIKSKHIQKMICIPQKRASTPFELVYPDPCGPMKHASISGNRYHIIFINDFTRWNFVYFLKTKTSLDSLSAFKEMRSFVRMQYGCHIKQFRCDNGKGEYGKRLSRHELVHRGIKFKPAPSYTQQKNGVSERRIQTLNTKARSMMLDANLPLNLWACKGIWYSLN
jgi:hypothetical protein